MTNFNLFNLSFEEIASYASEIGQQPIITNTNILVNPTLNPNAKNPPQKPGLTFFCSLSLKSNNTWGCFWLCGL